jgi:hypothetical protein
VQYAQRRDAERTKAHAKAVGLVASFLADVALWVLLGRQCVGVMH